MSDSDFERIRAFMSYLDKDEVFKYNYEVPSDKLVDNPVKAESFNNPNHIFNAFTICQLSDVVIN